MSPHRAPGVKVQPKADRDATRTLAMGIFTGFQILDIVPSQERPGTVDRLDPISDG